MTANLDELRLNREYRVVTDDGTLLESYDTVDEAQGRRDEANGIAEALGIRTRYHVVTKATQEKSQS